MEHEGVELTSWAKAENRSRNLSTARSAAGSSVTGHGKGKVKGGGGIGAGSTGSCCPYSLEFDRGRGRGSTEVVQDVQYSCRDRSTVRAMTWGSMMRAIQIFSKQSDTPVLVIYRNKNNNGYGGVGGQLQWRRTQADIRKGRRNVEVYGGGCILFRISEEGPRWRVGRKGSMVLLSDGLSEANLGRFG